MKNNHLHQWSKIIMLLFLVGECGRTGLANADVDLSDELDSVRASNKAAATDCYLRTFFIPQAHTNAAWHLQHTNILMVSVGGFGNRFVIEYLLRGSGEELSQRHTYDAIQAGYAEQLPASALKSLRSAIHDLPTESDSPPIEKLVMVSFREGTNWVTRTYDSSSLTKSMRRVFYIIENRHESQADSAIRAPDLECQIELPSHKPKPKPDGRLPIKLVLRNTGEKAIRLCTMCMVWQSPHKGSFTVTLTPDLWESDTDTPPLEESAKHVTTVQPGGIVEIPFEVSTGSAPAMLVRASYKVDAEFADKLKIWSGSITSESVTTRLDR